MPKISSVVFLSVALALAVITAIASLVFLSPLMWKCAWPIAVISSALLHTLWEKKHAESTRRRQGGIHINGFAEWCAFIAAVALLGGFGSYYNNFTIIWSVAMAICSAIVAMFGSATNFANGWQPENGNLPDLDD